MVHSMRKVPVVVLLLAIVVRSVFVRTSRRKKNHYHATSGHRAPQTRQRVGEMKGRGKGRNWNGRQGRNWQPKATNNSQTWTVADGIGQTRVIETEALNNAGVEHFSLTKGCMEVNTNVGAVTTQEVDQVVEDELEKELRPLDLRQLERAPLEVVLDDCSNKTFLDSFAVRRYDHHLVVLG